MCRRHRRKKIQSESVVENRTEQKVQYESAVEDFYEKYLTDNSLTTPDNLNIILSMEIESKIPDRLVIKKTKFRDYDFCYIVADMLVIVFVENVIIKLILLTFISVFAFYFIKRRLNNDKEQIIIDKEGITLRCNKIKCIQWNNRIKWNYRCIQWENIKYAYIKRTMEPDTGFSRSLFRAVDWFYIETTKSKITVEMTDFSYKSSLLNQCINHFSGRIIGHVSNDKINSKKIKAENRIIIIASFAFFLFLIGIVLFLSRK